MSLGFSFSGFLVFCVFYFFSLLIFQFFNFFSFLTFLVFQFISFLFFQYFFIFQFFMPFIFFIYINIYFILKYILTKNLTETRNRGNECQPSQDPCPPPYRHPLGTVSKFSRFLWFTRGSGRIRIPLTVQIRELKQASRSRFLTCTNPKSCFCMDSALDDWVRDEYYLHRVTKMKYTPLIPAVLSRKLTGLKFVRSCVNTSKTQCMVQILERFRSRLT